LIAKPPVKENIKKVEYDTGGYYNKLGGIRL
jgi:hypothetical protein